MTKESFNNTVAGVAVAVASILGLGTYKGTDVEVLAQTVATNTQKIERAQDDIKEVEDKSEDDHDRIIRIDANVEAIKEALEKIAR